MKIVTGKETGKGEFNTRVVGESQNGETAKDAIVRIAECFLSVPLSKKRHRWNEKWSWLGDENNPTERLPALFVGSRLFCVATTAKGNGPRSLD